MFDIFCVTDRKICRGNFMERIGSIAKCGPAGIILRCREMTEQEYKAAAREVMKICGKSKVRCILHGFSEPASELCADFLHMPMPALRKMTPDEISQFKEIGASCHSAEEAAEAERLGCSYITAGHVFDTACKKGSPGKGLDFLADICKAVSIPVYAIGGIGCGNIADVRDVGAAGVFIMSGFMECENAASYIGNLKKAVDL